MNTKTTNDLFCRNIAGVDRDLTTAENEVPSGETFLSLVQNFTVPCDCARKGTVKLGHYDVVRCPDCNCQFWALQPKRDGPLVLFPWPARERRAA